MPTILEFSPSSFVFDYIRWNKVYEDNTGKIRYGLHTDFYPGIHPLFKDPVGYMDKLCKNNGFIMWLGYVEECYVWDLTPIVIVIKDDDGMIQHGEVYVEGYRLDPFCMNCDILDNGRHASIEFTIPRTPDIATGVHANKDGSKENHHIYIQRGKLRYFSGRNNPLFSRIEGSLCVYSDRISDFASINSETIVKSIKFNLVNYVAMKMGVSDEYKFTDTMKNCDRWTILAKAESYIQDKKKSGTPGYIFMSFIMTYSITEDGYRILPFSEYYGNRPRFNFIAPNPNPEMNPLSCVYFYLPDNMTLDQEEMANVYLSMRFSNFKVSEKINHFIIPYTYHHLDTEYDFVHRQASSDCHAAFFNNQTSNLIFSDEKEFEESSYEKIMNEMDSHAASNTKYYIPDLRIRLKRKSSIKKEIMNFLFHKDSSSDLIREDFYIENPKYQMIFKAIVQISDYKIPKFERESDLYSYIHRIKNDIKRMLYDHPNWDYIPIQGFDILMAKNDLPYTSNSPEECLAKMIMNQEISRYSVLWGDVSSIGAEADRKQIHNQPVFPSGGRCLWIFA